MRLAQLEFLDLTGGRHREFADEANVFRDLEPRDLILAEIPQLFLCGRLAGFQPDRGRDLFAEEFALHGVDVDVRNGGVMAHQVFDLLGRDVLAAANYDVFDASGYAHIAVPVHRRLVACAQPAIVVNRRAGGIRVVVITLHHVVAAHDQLTGLVRAESLAGRRIDDPDLHLGQDHADGLGAMFDRVVAPGLRDAWRGFGQSVNDRDLAQVHFINRAPHQGLWTERSCHHAGAQRREVEAIELRVFHLGQEHRRHAVKRRAAFALDRLQDFSRVERLNGRQTGAVRIRPQHADHTAEAMKQWHTETQPVLRRIAQPAPEPVAVVDNVAARQHYSLRKSRRARRVLHVDHVVQADLTFTRVDLSLRDVRRHLAQLFIRRQTFGTFIVFATTDEDRPLQVRQFRVSDSADFAQRAHVIDVPEPADRDDRGRFALPQQIIDFRGAQSGVDRHQNRADLGQRELQRDPFGNVRSPQGHTLAAFDAAGHQAARDQSGLRIEFGEGQSQAAV